LLLSACLLMTASFISYAQTSSVQLRGNSSLCQNFYVTLYAVDASCNSYASNPILISPGTTLSPDLFNPSLWNNAMVPPVGFTIDAARVDQGTSCVATNVSGPTQIGCPNYDFAIVGSSSSCAYSVSSLSCFQQSGSKCSLCTGNPIRILYSKNENNGTVIVSIDIVIW